MKKFMLCVICFVLFLYGGTVKASASPALTVDVKGTMEAGQTIQILINVNNIDSFYAGAASLKYDPKIMKIISFEKGDLITKKGTNTFDAGNKIDNEKGLASFGGFSCLGQVNGFSGSGVFLKINAQLLKKDSFYIKSIPFLASPNDTDNLKIQLCDKNIKVVSYAFKGYEFKVNNGGKTEITNPVSETPLTTNPNISASQNPNTSTSQNTNTSNNTNTAAPNENSSTDTPNTPNTVVSSTNANVSTNSTTNPIINPSTDKSSGTIPESTSATPGTKSTTKTSNTALANKDSEKKKISEVSNPKNNESTDPDTGLINKVKNGLTEKNKTQKNSWWLKGILTLGTIGLVFAVVVRKKH